MTKNFLEHYGKKGMKWGVRKKPGSGTGKKTAGKKTTTKTEVTTTISKGGKKGVKGMSDTQLRTELNRLNMEKQYKSLTTNKKSKGSVSKGLGFVGGILKSAGRKSLKNYAEKEITAQLMKRRRPGGNP
jgi:hypothetical protein